MKFSALVILSTMATIASASNLRATTVVAAQPSLFADARVSMVGLKNEPSAQDLEVISESLVATYNDMYATAVIKAVEFEAKNGAVIASEVSGLTQCRHCAPDDDQMIEGTDKVVAAMVTGRIGLTQCRHCAPDDDQMVLTKVEQCRHCAPDDDSMNVMEAFSAKVCHKLRTSVSKNFANVRDCSIVLDATVAAGASSELKAAAKVSLKDMIGMVQAQLLM